MHLGGKEFKCKRKACFAHIISNSVKNQIWRRLSSISPRSFRHLPKSCRKRRGPTMARRLLGESLGEARRRLRRLLLEEREASEVAQTSCDEKWRKGWRRLLLEEAWGMPAKGCGDYSWRQPGGKLAKWRELPAKWREMPAKWREVPAKWREVPAKWRKVAAKWRLLLESVRRVWW